MAAVSFDFTGKRALVTGGGRGIGKSICIALAKAGAQTFALGKTKENLDALVSEYPSIHPVCADLSNWMETRKAVETIGPIDLLVNNAGISIVQPLLEVSEEAADQIFDVNVKAVINVTQVVARGMIERKYPGSIVNVSSQASLRALEDHTVYCASKAALDSLTRTMALELGPHQIRVNSVNPTVVLTDMGRRVWSAEDVVREFKKKIPLGRFAEESEVVGPVLYLLSDSSSMVSGTFLLVDGGLSV